MKKNLVVGFILLLVLVLSVGGYLWLQSKFKEYAEDGTRTLSLSPHILDNFKNGVCINDYPFVQENITWDSYLVLEDFVLEPYTVRYISLWNTTLQTEKYLPGDNVQGIVTIRSGDQELEQDAIIEILETEFKKEDLKAFRRYSVLQYFDISRKTILARDTIWGKMPDKESIQTGLGYGKFPKNKDVVKAITKRVNKSY